MHIEEWVMQNTPPSEEEWQSMNWASDADVSFVQDESPALPLITTPFKTGKADFHSRQKHGWQAD